MTVVLAIESATDAAGVALADESGVLAAVRIGRGRRHAETIALGAQAVCRYAEVPLAQVGGVAVDIGPGLFTGLRVGIATAKGLAYGLGVPMVAVSSLRLLADGAAQAMVPGPLATVVSVVDARRQEVFWAQYPLVASTCDAGALEAGAGSAPRVGRPDELVTVLDALATPGPGASPQLGPAPQLGPTPQLGPAPQPEPGGSWPRVVLVGDGARRYGELLERPGVVVGAASLSYPCAELLGVMAVDELRAGRGVDPVTVAACYLREPDARINWEQRAPQRARAGDRG